LRPARDPVAGQLHEKEAQMIDLKQEFRSGANIEQMDNQKIKIK